MCLSSEYITVSLSSDHGSVRVYKCEQSMERKPGEFAWHIESGFGSE